MNTEDANKLQYISQNGLHVVISGHIASAMGDSPVRISAWDEVAMDLTFPPVWKKLDNDKEE